MTENKSNPSNPQPVETQNTSLPQYTPQQVQQYLDLAGVILVALDTRGRIAMINRRGRETLGFEQNELLGQDWFATCLPEPIGRTVKQTFKRAMRGEIELPGYGESPILTHSGEERIIAWHNTILTDETGQITGALSSGEDITARKRSEEKMRRRNRELSLLNRIIAASTTHQEPEGFLDLACRELADGFDMPYIAISLLNEDKTAAVITAEFSPEGKPSALQQDLPVNNHPAYQFILANKAPLVIDDTQRNPYVRPIKALLHQRGIEAMLLLPLIIEGEVIGSLDLGIDEPHHFTPQQVSLAWSVADQLSGTLARFRLDETRRQLSAAIEQAAESVLITDSSGKIRYVNPAFEQTSGYSREEVIGRNPRLLQSGKHDAAFYQALWHTLRAGDVWHGQFVNRNKAGQLYTEEATISPVRNEHNRIVNFVSVQRDVTRELELETQYRQSQRMEAVGQLAAGVAHDFNNLLTVINGFAELIKHKLAPDDPIISSIDMILHAGGNAADLVRQLLIFSRKQIIEPRLLDLNNVVQDIETMLRRLIGAHIELETIPAADLWPIKGDPSQLEQVVINLVVNARDAMPDGGRLTLETSNVTLSEDYAADHLDVEVGDYVLLSVSDTGVGMSDKIKNRIFEPFFTTKEAGRGTGLGLSTVFGIVKQAGGFIWVYSELGQGTTIKVYLPRIHETTARGDELDANRPLPHGRETILLVEDDPMVRQLAAEFLTEQGYTILQATNGIEALTLAQAVGAQIDLLLTDVIMPQMGGRELADRLADLFPNLKILFTSGYTGNTIARYGIPESDIAFIQKPFSPIDLAHKVRAVLDR